MSERKQIIRDQWPRYLSEVTAGNKGRKIALGVIGRPDVSPEGISERASISIPLTDAPFLAVEYGPVEKGNAIIISVGVEAVVYEHAVDAPVELTSNLDANFRVRNVRGEATGKPIPLRRPLYAIGFKGSRAEECFPNMPVKCNLVRAATMVYDTYRSSIGYKYRDLCRKWGGAGLAATVLVLECFFCLHGAIWRDNLYIYMPLDIATLMG